MSLSELIPSQQRFFDALGNEIEVPWERYKDKDARLIAIDLNLRGVSLDRIYEIYTLKNTAENKPCIAKESLMEFLDKYTPKLDLAEVKVYGEYRKELLNKMESKILGKLEQKIESIDVHAVDENGRDVTPLKDLVYSFDKLMDKRRLEEDKATSKVENSHSVLVESIMKRRVQEGRIVDV